MDYSSFRVDMVGMARVIIWAFLISRLSADRVISLTVVSRAWAKR
jgi:hypothetical protein